MSKHWVSYVGAVLAGLGLLFNAARWVGRIDTRVDQLERFQRYQHGSYELPTEAK